MKFKTKKEMPEISHLSIFSSNNIIQIKINEPLCYEDFYKELKNNLNEYDFNYVHITQLIKNQIKGTLVIIKGVRKSYNILINDDYQFFSKNIVHLKGSRLVTLTTIKPHDYEVTEKIISDKKKRFRRYNNSNQDNAIFLKNEALAMALKMLKDLKGIKESHEYFSSFEILEKLNVVKEEFINPVCTDGVITFSEKINPGFLYFEIILNETNENLGFISWNGLKDHFTYDGNLSCEIKSNYRNKGYSTRALKLLLEYLKKYNVKDVFLSTRLDNKSVQKVALKSGGTLILKGYVTDDKIKENYNLDEVMVYKLQIKK